MAYHDKKSHSQLSSFKYAAEGIRESFKSERNLKIHAIFAALAIGASWYFNIKPIEWCLIILCIGGVLTAELINTSLENIVDLTTQYQFHPLAKKSKDAAAGAVFIFAITALIVGIIIFTPYLIETIFQ